MALFIGLFVAYLGVYLLLALKMRWVRRKSGLEINRIIRASEENQKFKAQAD
jgi:hypothetical protein